jgi:hypothetical protein
MTAYTLDGSTTATGIGTLKSAYEKLLFSLCMSGCSLPELRVIPSGFARTVIEFKVQGTSSQLDVFRREFKV